MASKRQTEFTSRNQELKEQQQAEIQMKKQLGNTIYQEGLRLEASPFSFAEPFARNQAQTISCYQKAAESGSANAAYRPGEIHQHRIGLISPLIEQAKKSNRILFHGGQSGPFKDSW